jgi:hypothetical protein
MLARRTVSSLFVVGVVATVALGCSSSSDVDPGDDDLGTGNDDVVSACKPTDDAIFFHGLSGFGREITTARLCVPKIENTGASGFWSGVAFTRAENAKVVGGFSAGRLPLVRRLARGEGNEATAIMLDPSYSETGPSIVEAWLAANEERKFVLVYSPSSTGWSEYAALAAGPHGDRVRVCAVPGAHAELPRKVGAELFLDPESWLDTRCSR